LCKIIIDVPKITCPKWMLSLCFKARPPFSMMKKHHSHHFQAQKRREGFRMIVVIMGQRPVRTLFISTIRHLTHQNVIYWKTHWPAHSTAKLELVRSSKVQFGQCCDVLLLASVCWRKNHPPAVVIVIVVDVSTVHSHCRRRSSTICYNQTECCC
jgi:hypothetical protein